MQGSTPPPAAAFIDRPPPPPGWYPVYRPKAGEARTFVALAGELTGAMLHYVAGRSVICTGHDNGCKRCKTQHAHWEGYLFGFAESEKRIYIVGVTAGAVRNCWGVRAALLVRGRKFTISRDDHGPNARVSLVLHEHVGRADHLPESPDLRDCLSRLWAVGYDVAMDEKNGRGRPSEGDTDGSLVPA